MADYLTLTTRSVARKAARNRIGYAINSLFPDHVLILLNEDYTVPSTKYISLRIFTDGKTNSSGMNLVPISIDLTDTGEEATTFHVTQRYQVKFHKGSAMDDATYLLERLANKQFLQMWFGDVIDPDTDETITNIGITNIADEATDLPTSVDFGSSWESGATLSFDLNYLFKTTETVDSIEQVNFTVTTKAASGAIISEGTAIKP
jgi:hypothetical protein